MKVQLNLNSVIRMYCSNIAYEYRSICNGSPLDRYCRMSRHIGKSTICIGKISVFAFATQYTIPLLSKSNISKGSEIRAAVNEEYDLVR